MVAATVVDATTTAAAAAAAAVAMGERRLQLLMGAKGSRRHLLLRWHDRISLL